MQRDRYRSACVLPDAVVTRIARARTPILTPCRAILTAVSEWLHELPVPLIALVVIVGIAVLIAVVHLITQRLAAGRWGDAIRGVSPSLLPPLGIVFALIVGVFIVFNSFAIAMTHRRAEIGILRALGATCRQIEKLFLFESVVAGLIGSAVGLLAPIAVRAAQNYAIQYLEQWIASQPAGAGSSLFGAGLFPGGPAAGGGPESGPRPSSPPGASGRPRDVR